MAAAPHSTGTPGEPLGQNDPAAVVPACAVRRPWTQSAFASAKTALKYVATPAGSESPLTHKIARGVSWQIGLSILGRFITFAAALVQTRILGREGYGELGVVLSTMMLFALVPMAPGGQTATKYIAELRESNPDRAGRIAALSLLTTLVFSVVAGVLLYWGSDFVATRLLDTPRLRELLVLAAISLGFQSFLTAYCGILLGLQLFTAEAVVRFAQLPAWLIGIVLLTEPYGTTGAMMAYTISQGVGFFAAAYAATRALKKAGLRLPFRSAWSEAGVLTRYSWPLLLHSVLFIPTTWICYAIVARMPGGYAVIGSYTAAVQFRNAVTMLPMTVQMVVWPILNEFRGKGEASRFNRLFKQTMQSQWSLGLAGVIVLTVLQKEIMTLFGKEFSQDHFLLGLCLACAPAMMATNFIGLALQTLDKTWASLNAYAAYLIVCSGLTYFLVDWHLGIGMAVAFIVGTGVQFGWLAVLMSRASSALPLARTILILVITFGAAIATTYIAVVLASSGFVMRTLVQMLLVAAAAWLVWAYRPAVKNSEPAVV